MVDEMTSEIKKIEVFCVVQRYTYCGVVWSQRKEGLIKECENTMLYFEGIQLVIAPDNLKTTVTWSDRNELVSLPEAIQVIQALLTHLECILNSNDLLVAFFLPHFPFCSFQGIDYTVAPCVEGWVGCLAVGVSQDVVNGFLHALVEAYGGGEAGHEAA